MYGSIKMIEYIGVIGTILLNIATLPQIQRIIRLRDSKSISISNILLAITGLGIMLLTALKSDTAIFILNYVIALVLEVALLVTTLYYRRPTMRPRVALAYKKVIKKHGKTLRKLKD